MSEQANDGVQTESNAWAVKGLETADAVDLSREGKSRYELEIPTIVKHSENSTKTTAEHTILTGTNDLASVTRLPATRMAKYASIAIINCNLQVQKEADLKPTFEQLQPFILDYSTSREFKEKMLYLERDSLMKAKAISEKVISDRVNTTEEKEAKVLYEAVKNNYSKLENPSHTSEQYLQNILFDRIHMSAMEKTILADLEPKLVEHAKENGFKTLSHRGKDRTTYIFAGAPASGKGASVARRRFEALVQGKNWSDMAKINTDTHRDFIIDDRLTTQKLEDKAGYNHDEANLISDMSYRLHDKKAEEGKASDMLVDGVFIKQSKIDTGLKNGGRVKIDVVSIPAEKGVERAFSRGPAEKRFVAKGFILAANAEVAKDFHNIMSANSGKNIEYRLFDNDIAKGGMPILVEKGDLSKKIVEVYRPDLLNKFLKKQNINTRADSPNEVYPAHYETSQPGNRLHTGMQSNQSIKVEYKNTSVKQEELVQTSTFKSAINKFIELGKNSDPTKVKENASALKQKNTNVRQIL